MDNRDEKELEAVIDRELKKLPDLKAPETLIHRVMLEVHVRAKAPWWKRPWLSWPLSAQCLSLALLVLSVGLVSYLLGAAWDGINVSSISSRFAEWGSTYALLWESLKSLANAVVVLARQIGKPLLFFAVGSSLAIYFGCVGLGTVCFRFALKRPERS